MMNKILTGLLFCLLAYPHPVNSQSPIRVAAIFSMSGEAVAISIEHLTTTRFAVDEINARGGILGRPIELIELDNESTPLGARRAAMEAIRLGVSAVVGGSWSSHALGMATPLQQAKIPTLSPTATNPKVTRVGNYIFRVCFIDSFQGHMLAQFAHQELNAEKVAVLTNVDQVYAIGLSRQFIKSFQQSG
ncbi:MAG: ethanolamine utilization protein EutJ, partial [Desulfobacteraceae bacterium]